jgi:hypothetical protein
LRHLANIRVIVWSGTRADIRTCLDIASQQEKFSEIDFEKGEKVGVRGGSTGHGLARSTTPNRHHSVPELEARLHGIIGV